MIGYKRDLVCKDETHYTILVKVVIGAAYCKVMVN